MHHKSYMLASLGRDSPVSMVMMHVWFIGIRVHYGEFTGKSIVRPLFLLSGFSVESEFKSTFLGPGYLASLDWAGPAPWATPS